MDIQQSIKSGGDVVATAVAGATLLEYLPEGAAACSIVWFTVQMIINWPILKQRLKDVFKK